MGLNRLGDKLSILYFLNGLLAQPTLHFLGGKRNRIAAGAGRGTGTAVGPWWQGDDDGDGRGDYGRIELTIARLEMR